MQRFQAFATPQHVAGAIGSNSCPNDQSQGAMNMDAI
jgi:hypothetical protein